MSVRIVYEDIAAGAAEDAAVTTGSAQPFADAGLLPFEGGAPPLATLEPGSWLLEDRKSVV